jgi:hypothetical protein
MNLSQHLNLFYQYLKEPDTSRYPIALVKEFLDESERVVNKESKQIRSSSIVNSVSDQQLYDLPSDILDWNIKEVYYSVTDSTERRRLIPISMQKLDSMDRGWREREGTPAHWYLDREQNKWGLFPFEQIVQTGTNCIEILYRSKHTKMTTYYTTGTVDITYNTTSVTGNGTAWIGNVVANDELGIGKLLNRTTAFPTTFFGVATTPVSDTALTLSTAFSQATVSTASYIISSPSSITNEELNMGSVLWAMGLAKGKDGDYTSRNALQSESLARVSHELTLLEKDASSEESITPELNEPYPGTTYNDYGRHYGNYGRF